jgi:Tfp pilus assembly protein FimV
VPVAPVAPPAAAPVEIVAQAETPEPRPAASERVHTVRSGESLWSIAEDLLGPGASTAEIARAVERLWKLNAERIGSGDPDLIVAGERLIVPAGL